MHISAKLVDVQSRTFSQPETVLQALGNICYALDRNMLTDVVIKDKNISLFRWTENDGVIKMYGEDKSKIGNVFNTSDSCIIHGVNCLGVMGAGIALQIRNRFPKVFQEYSEYVKQCNLRGISLIGRAQFVEVGIGNYIVNAFTQEKTAKNIGDVAISYSAILNSLMLTAQGCVERGIKSVSMPRIGSDLGGGDWGIVRSIINAVFESVGIEVTVYVLPKEYVSKSNRYLFEISIGTSK